MSLLATIPQKQIDSQDEAKRRYLEASSRRLTTICPAIAARLQRQKLLIEERKSAQSVDPSNINCSSCGQVLIPGLTCEQRRLVKRPKKSQTPASTRLLHVKCLLCSQDVTITRRRDAKPSKNAPVQTLAKATTNETSNHSTSIVPETEAGTSVEHRKATSRRQRGKASSLKALLDNNQKQASSVKAGLGFDISDLLKK